MKRFNQKNGRRNKYFVSVSLDGSDEEQGQQKILPLIELQSRILKIYDFPKYQLSTTDDKENDKKSN